MTNPDYYTSEQGRIYCNLRVAAQTLGLCDGTVRDYAECRKAYGLSLDVIQHGPVQKTAAYGPRKRRPLYIAVEDVFAMREAREQRLREHPEDFTGSAARHRPRLLQPQP